MLKLFEASSKDAAVLAQVSKRAFDSDVDCGNLEVGGPPGYDQADWQVEMMNHPKSTYYKILLGDQVIGGAIVFKMNAEKYCLGRIFIDTKYHSQGIGAKAMKMIEGMFPEAKHWVLDTPAWNERTRYFYQKVGYTLIKEDRDLLFEKKIG